MNKFSNTMAVRNENDFSKENVSEVKCGFSHKEGYSCQLTSGHSDSHAYFDFKSSKLYQWSDNE